jgi:ATP-dependent RNA helicase RhlE
LRIAPEAALVVVPRRPPERKIHMKFEQLGLSQPILEALTALSITNPTPIQLAAIPAALKGNDVVGLAQTGTGKTAAFALPLIEKIVASGRRPSPRKVHALILSPTRELASQIHKSIRDFSRRVKLRSVLAVGGLSINTQTKNLSGGAEILIATPGRLEDLIRQGAVSLDEARFVVLDEADQMLDIGFMPAIRRVFGQLPAKRQAMLFSATMPDEIRKLAARYLNDPVEVSVTPTARTADRIEQGVMHVSSKSKPAALAAVINEHDGDKVIVFARTKHGADKLVRRLDAGGIEAAAIHGNKSQGQREKALARFRDGSLHVLVATDIAARGIDVPGVTLVINHDLPNVPEVYVHRIGRTARAGAAGLAIAFCAPDERPLLRDIEKLIKQAVPVLPTPEGIETAVEPVEQASQENQRRGHRGWSGKGGPGGQKAGGQKAGGQKRRRPRNAAPGGRPEGGRAEGGSADSQARPDAKRPFRSKRRKSGGGNGQGGQRNGGAQRATG